MPLAILAGLAVLALEIGAIAWGLHWLLSGTVGWLVITVVTAMALGATLVAWAAIGVGNHADDELDKYMAAADGQPTGRAKQQSRPSNLASASLTPDGQATGQAAVVMELAHRKTTENFGL